MKQCLQLHQAWKFSCEAIFIIKLLKGNTLIASKKQFNRISLISLVPWGAACGRSAGDQRDHLCHSEWVCNGRTLPKAMTRTRRSTIASCVGARWAYQPHFCGTGWQSRKPDQLMIGATQLKAHLTAASLLERGCSPPYRSHQGRLEFKTPCRVRQHGQACCPAALRRPDERLQR